MNRIPTRTLLLLALLALSPLPTQAEPDEAARILAAIKDFYRWVLADGKHIVSLQPKIVEEENSSRFHLDMSTLPPFSNAFMASGFFTADFPAALERYYSKYQREFAQYPQQEFDEIAKYGRGPMMDVEDMDIFFCAQEYDYTAEFVDALTLKNIEIKGDSAQVSVVSTYQWETPFTLEKIDGQWRIAGYCVYE